MNIALYVASCILPKPYQATGLETALIVYTVSYTNMADSEVALFYTNLRCLC